MIWIFNESYIRLLAYALGNTVMLSAFVILASNILAMPLAIYMRRPKRRLRKLLIGYSFFARATPVLAILFVLYYGLPRVGIYLDPIPSALIGLTFSSTAYNLEFLRSGFESLPPGQEEAAKALGLKPFATLFKVLVPQAYVSASPALFSNAVQIVKGSSLASLVAVDELTGASTTLISETYKAIEVLSVVGLIYALIAGLIVILQTLFERSQRWAGL